MSHVFQLLYLAIMAIIVMAGTYTMSRSQQLSPYHSLREALTWGGCLILSAMADYLMIVPGADYLITPA